MIEKISEILNIDPYNFLVSHEKEQSFDKDKFIDDASKMIEKNTRQVLSNLFANGNYKA